MIERKDHPRNATPVFPNVPLPGGPTHVVIASTWTRHCGCSIHIGLRADNQEKAMMSTPCDAHADRFQEVVDFMLTDEGRELPTDEAFDLGVAGIEAVS